MSRPQYWVNGWPRRQGNVLRRCINFDYYFLLFSPGTRDDDAYGASVQDADPAIPIEPAQTLLIIVGDRLHIAVLGNVFDSRWA